MRPTVQAIYHNTTIIMLFADMDAAKASYEKISEALGEYKMFRNERKETINVETDGGLTTLRLERLDALFLNSVESHERDLQERLDEELKIRRRRLEMGLPSLPDQPTDDVISLEG